jgi:hypothetical protein
MSVIWLPFSAGPARCFTLPLHSLNGEPEATKNLASIPQRRFKQSINFIPTSRNGRTHYPPENCGLPPKGKVSKWKMDHTACSTSCSRTARCIYSAALPSFFTLPSTHPRATHSFTPPYYSFISHSTNPLIFLAIALNHPFFALCTQFSQSLSSAHGRHPFSRLQSFMQALCPLI